MTAPHKGMVAAQLEGLGGGLNLECAPRPGQVRVFVEDFLVDPNSKAVAIGKYKVTVLNLEGFGKDFISKGEWIHDGLASMAVAGVFKP